MKKRYTNDVLNEVLPVAYETAAKRSRGIDPVSQPKSTWISMEKGEAWVIKAEVTVKPEVKLGDYKENLKFLSKMLKFQMLT